MLCVKVAWLLAHTVCCLHLQQLPQAISHYDAVRWSVHQLMIVTRRCWCCDVDSDVATNWLNAWLQILTLCRNVQRPILIANNICCPAWRRDLKNQSAKRVSIKRVRESERERTPQSQSQSSIKRCCNISLCYAIECKKWNDKREAVNGCRGNWQVASGARAQRSAAPIDCCTMLMQAVIKPNS